MTDPVMAGAPETQVPAQAPEPQPAAPLGTPAPAGPELVDFNLAGRVVKVTREAAQALYELSQPRQQAAPPPPAPAADDIDTLWFTNPKAAAQRIRDDVRNEITQQYQADQNARQLWSRWDHLNPDLNGVPKPFVISVLQQHDAEFSRLPPDEGLKRLGDEVRRVMLASVSKFGQTLGEARGSSEPVPQLEGATQRTAQAQQAAQPQEPAEPETLSQAIRARREARRAAIESSRRGNPSR